MKKIYTFILILLFTQQLFSQYSSNGIGRWKLGLNIGGTFQTADVSNKLFGLGYGATLAYEVWNKRSSFFGFSLRGRFLQGQTFGQDYQLNTNKISNDAINGIADSTINYANNPLFLNNKTSFKEYSLEAMLKWNQLYQNHGILFYLYFGGGATNYITETNQLDAFGDVYDYSVVNANASKSNIINQIESFSDGNYETSLINSNYNKFVFTPSVGIGIGFRIVPGFDIAFEHKVSLPQTDLFDGQIYKSAAPSFIQDIYHYTSLGLIFSIIKHNTNQGDTYIPPTTIETPPTPIVPITTPKQPKITLVKPLTNTFNTPNCKVTIIAKIDNVVSQSDISFFQNGTEVASYKYFFTLGEFKSTIDLKEGNNTFKIIAKNGNLKDIKEFSLRCNNITKITICHKNNDGTFKTIEINENDWNSHKAHGDTKGTCISNEKQITICHVVSGKVGVTQTISIPESRWLIHQSHGDVLGVCHEKKLIQICHFNQPLTINESDWPKHQAHGDIKGNCPQIKMITICHVPPTGNKRQNLTIPENEWIVHQAHGDKLGTCPSVESTIVICHNKGNGKRISMTIPEFRWNEHFSHGDSKGKCPEISFIICHKNPTTGKKENISIYESAWPQHQAHGDTKGACPVVTEQLITICHRIPGGLGKTQTIIIPQSKWLLHKSHGDKLGTCVVIDKNIQICHNNPITHKKEDLVIKESQWPKHQSHRDTKGKCPVVTEQLITICHRIPGGLGKTQTIIIPQSKWLLHKSHGDKLGTCVAERNIQICHKNATTGKKENIIIKQSQWLQHQAHGDTKGICPPEDTNSSIDTGDEGEEGNTQITICHHPSGNTSTPQTIQINEAIWPIHRSHGDTRGTCPVIDNDIQICHKNPSTGKKENMTIKQSQWLQHQAHGDVKGVCPPEDNSIDTGDEGEEGNTQITICHHPTGNATVPQTIQINQTVWPIHRSHGDTQGACASAKKKILKNNLNRNNRGGN